LPILAGRFEIELGHNTLCAGLLIPCIARPQVFAGRRDGPVETAS